MWWNKDITIYYVPTTSQNFTNVPKQDRTYSHTRLYPKGEGETESVAYTTICSQQNFRGMNLIG